MYMGVIPFPKDHIIGRVRAPHVYGGDPMDNFHPLQELPCSPCIWG